MVTAMTPRVARHDQRTPWLSRCPNGHANVVVRRTKDETECRSCGLRWRGRPFDARRVSGFPVAGGQYEVISE